MQKERRGKELEKRNNETEPDTGMGNDDYEVHLKASPDILLYISLWSNLSLDCRN